MQPLLSPASYDDDASLHSPTPSDQDTDSEDDEFLRNSRTTLELAQYDRTVLDEEDEREKLLIRGNSPADGLRRIFSPIAASQTGSVRIGKKERRRRRQQQREEERKRRRRSERDEQGRLLYEMEDEEEGGHSDGDSVLRRSEDSVGFDEKAYYQNYETGGSKLRYALVLAAVFVLFMILLLGAYKASAPFRASRRVRPLLSNGTALFAPTTILISLDGFRADFLHRGITPALSSFIAQGVSPEYMLPSFPSVTFPNHFTLVTGLYPESHGVVGNSFFDPDLEEEFYYTDSANSMRPKWWTAEPIWNTMEKHGLKSAVHMWPGSEAHIGGVDPSIVDEYNGSEDLSRKTDRILSLLDLPGEEESTGDAERPQLIAAYVPDVDAHGHKYGPNSTVIQGTIARVDSMLAELFKGLDARNLTDVVNVVIVSDHGMATTDVERLVQLEDLIDLDLVDHIDGWPSRGLRPKNPESHKILEQQLQDAAPNYSHAVEIYSLDTMPERYHFTNNRRIAPLWVIPKTGWAIVERPDFDAKKALETGEDYSPKGIHGYDHEHPLMRAIFLAKGPAFAAPPNSRLDPFQNVNVYNIICDSLGIEPQPNNGTLRLPLQPVGLHSDATENEDDHLKESPNTTISNQPGQPGHPDSEDDTGPTWWATLWGKVDEFKHWAGSMAEAVKDNVVDN